MRIGILTWHKAVNHGAVLQAYASQQVLRSIGCEAKILEHERYVKKKQVSLGKKVINVLKKITIKKLIGREIIKSFNKEKSIRFDLFRKKYLDLGEKYTKEQGLDAVLIGSDMVFEFYQGYNSYMYGKGVRAPYKFSYAASFGKTTDDSLKKHNKFNEICTLIRELNGIGYRDENTRKLIEKYAGRVDLTFNIDPVLLYGFKQESIQWDEGKWINHKPYIVVYSYDSNMNSKKDINMIRNFAKKNDLVIVSLGYYHNWCDECICSDPKEFIEILYHAQYVVTDTFHGTIFSLIMEKEFASIIRGNGFKLKYLLDSSGMSSRIVNNNDLGEVLGAKVDYNEFNKWLEFERANSLEYIKKQIENAKN